MKRVVGDRIYVFLYPGIESQRILILDLDGNLLDVSVIPFDISILETSTFRVLFKNLVYNGAKYFLRENNESGNWELQRLKISGKTTATGHAHENVK